MDEEKKHTAIIVGGGGGGHIAAKMAMSLAEQGHPVIVADTQDELDKHLNTSAPTAPVVEVEQCFRKHCFQPRGGKNKLFCSGRCCKLHKKEQKEK